VERSLDGVGGRAPHRTGGAAPPGPPAAPR
jgi:hypothetical protein